MTRQNLRLVVGNVSEMTFEGFGDVGVQRASRLAQQRPISRVLYECVLEQISGMWPYTLPKQQTGAVTRRSNVAPKSASGLRATAAKTA